MKPLTDLITIHPDYVSGNVLFRGTRVPVKILFEYLKKSTAIDEFIDAHPSVERSQVIDMLELIEYFLTFKKEPTYEEAKDLARRKRREANEGSSSTLRSKDDKGEELAN